MKNKFCWSLVLSLLTLSTISCQAVNENIEFGLTLRDTKDKFSIFTDGSVATNIVQEKDGSVSWVATAADGAGGGVSFYLKENMEEINIANYESMDLELDYSPVRGKWNNAAKNPGFCVRILPWDSSGLFGGFEDLECFESGAYSGSVTRNIKIPSDFVDKIIASSDFDSILGFAIKFNDYQRGNSDGDQLQVTLKNVKFNAKKDAPEDKPFDDGLTDDQRGTVVEIFYPTRDYTVQEFALTPADRYEKHGWVYLPAGYDASDKDTKYPVFFLLHGNAQNENTWGLSNKGRGGKIKGYMDRGMASGEVEKFILVVVTEIASKKWGPNGAGTDAAGAAAFGGEFRNDLLPYMRAKFNVKDGRDNVAMGGLSMGARETYVIGIGQCLDLISNFAVFSGALSPAPETNQVYQYVAGVDANPDFKGLKIHNFYMNCGTADHLMYDKYPTYVKVMKSWDRIENILEYTFPGGTHDFPVWYKGFKDFITIVFKTKEQIQQANAKPKTITTTTTVVSKPTEVQTVQYKCLSEVVGYPCCDEGITEVYYHDDNGDWGVDFTNMQWCGLTPYSESSNDETCWSEKLGYPCCKSCNVYDTDADGKWGIENNQWCGIQSNCSA